MRNSRLISIHFIVVVVIVLASGCSRSLVEGDAVLFPEPPENAITFWGHACFYIDVDGFAIAIDPVFEKWTVFRRRTKPAPPPSNYEGTDVILISHSHADHLSPNTIKTFPEDAVILCPEPAAGYLKDLGREYRVMKPGDQYDYPGGKIVAVRAHHTGGRWSIRPAQDGRALGYVIYTPGSRIYYSGDTNYFNGIDDIGIVHRPDVAILNINGHMHGTDAVLAAFATVAPVVIPSHFGVYGFLFVGEQKLPRDYGEIKGVLDPVLQLVKPGESVTLDGRRLLTKRTDLP